MPRVDGGGDARVEVCRLAAGDLEALGRVLQVLVMVRVNLVFWSRVEDQGRWSVPALYSLQLSLTCVGVRERLGVLKNSKVKEKEKDLGCCKRRSKK